MNRMNLFLILIILFVPVSIFSQENTPDHFLLGSYLNSSNNKHITYYQNYEQVRAMGMNTVLQRNIVGITSIDQDENFNSLLQFPIIVAINDSADYPEVQPENIDWIYYFTNALYSKWEAEGSPNFNSNEAVGVKHNGIGYSTSDGWSSGTEPSTIGKYFILGPNYTQYMRYVYSNIYNPNNPIIQYTANFSLKLGQVPEPDIDVAEIAVTVLDVETGEEIPIASQILNSTNLSTGYLVKSLSYNYSNLIDVNNGYNGSPPGPAWYAPQGTPESNFIDFRYKIQFKVKRLSSTEIIVDYIEVYDGGLNGIWENSFIGEENYQETVNLISTYNQQFSELGAHQKYFHTIDEPHSIDCFIPIQKVQHILDSLQIGKDLLTHFYPGWDNYRDSVNIMQKWVDIAQPEKLLFWYFPYWVDVTNQFGLEAFRGRSGTGIYDKP